MENQTNNQDKIENKSEQKKQVINSKEGKQVVVVRHGGKGLIWLIVIIIIGLGATLPFHYIPSRSMVFPKNSITFSYTFITEDDIEELIARYNKASFFEKQAMNNEPIVRKLMEMGVIREINDEDNNNNNNNNNNE